MALSISKLRSGINKYHGGDIKIVERNQDGTPIAGAPVVNLGYLKQVKFLDNTDSEDLKDVTGGTIDQELGDRSVQVSGIMMQTDDAVLDISEEVRGKYYGLYTQLNRPGSLTAIDLFIGVGTITPKLDIEWPGGENPFEYKASVLSNSISISGAALTASGTAGFGAYTSSPVTIASGKYFTKVKTAVSGGVL